MGPVSRPKPLRKRFPALLAHPPRATLPDPASARLRPSGALCGASGTGLDVARQLGRKGGRKPKMTDSKIESAKKLLASGVPPKDVAKNLGVSVPTLYRWVPASTQV